MASHLEIMGRKFMSQLNIHGLINGGMHVEAEKFLLRRCLRW